MRLGPPVAVLRSFDEAKAREFYVGFLGFTVDWEHRFEPDLPLYMQVRCGDCVLHLSEHHGDATPGGRVRIEVDVLEELHRALTAKVYRFARPGLEDRPWGAREIAVADPFGNTLVFWQSSRPGPADHSG